MKAIVYTKYGAPDVLELKEVEKPTAKDDEVLVKVLAASAAAGDWRLLRAQPFLMRLTYGLLKPKHKILGAAFAGRVGDQWCVRIFSGRRAISTRLGSLTIFIPCST